MSAPCPVLGFTIRVSANPSLADDGLDELIDDLMTFLEANGLVGAGEGDRTLEFVVHRDGMQAVEQDRAMVETWATRWSDRATIDVGLLTDLNPAA
jgi:uncharacterized protein YggL (DUF469 family)